MMLLDFENPGGNADLSFVVPVLLRTGVPGALLVPIETPVMSYAREGEKEGRMS
jgi:hypothetical protein